MGGEQRASVHRKRVGDAELAYDLLVHEPCQLGARHGLASWDISGHLGELVHYQQHRLIDQAREPMTRR